MLYRPTTPTPQDDQDKLRHRCRNPKCRSKLPAPVENPRDAFCCRGCHTSFYLHRCLVCEREMPRNAGNQKVCYRADCKEKWRLKVVSSRFLDDGGPSAKLTSETPIKPGVKTGLNTTSEAGRPWRQVAGLTMSPRSFAAAIVPDGPGGQWAGGAYERIEATNRKRLELGDNGSFTEPNWREVVSLDGVKCFVVSFREPRQVTPSPAVVDAAETARLIASIPSDLHIPGFLKRTVTS